jgi:hypothetical protein
MTSGLRRLRFVFRIRSNLDYGARSRWTMLKSLHSRHNDVFLRMLRSRRESQRLRQLDLAARLGRGQATVSKVERGTRRLDVVELWAWLNALDIDFVTFNRELDQRLRANPVPDSRFRASRHRSALKKK